MRSANGSITDSEEKQKQKGGGGYLAKVCTKGRLQSDTRGGGVP